MLNRGTERRYKGSGKGGLVIYGVCLVTSGEPVGLILEKGVDADCRERISKGM